MTILVLGATGLLGSAVFRRLSATMPAVYGTLRNKDTGSLFAPSLTNRLVPVDNLEKIEQLTELLDKIEPTVVVNCLAVGRPAPVDPIRSFIIHSALPQRLAKLCLSRKTRLIHISSDGVFSGRRGSYTEDDIPDANDVYGLSKLLGEVDGSHAITLRTSMIGHELISKTALLEWFLSQHGQCRCHTRAIFSGFPTAVLADILKDIIIPRAQLRGIYHVASRPISKFDLLQLVAQRYGKSIDLIPDEQVSIDRSLIANRFAKETGYVAPEWPQLVDFMYRDKFGAGGDNV